MSNSFILKHLLIIILIKHLEWFSNLDRTNEILSLLLFLQNKFFLWHCIQIFSILYLMFSQESVRNFLFVYEINILIQSMY